MIKSYIYILGIIGVVFCMSALSFSQPLNNFNTRSEPEGFGDIKWGTDLSTLRNMKFSRVDPSYGGTKIYIRTGVAPQIGEVELKNIEYLFWKGKFNGVSIIMEGISEYKPFKETLFQVFGEGSKPHLDQEYYVWDGEVTLMALEYNPVGERVLFWMMGKTILKQMESEDN